MRRFFIKFHSFWVENVLFYTTHIAYVGLLTYSWKIGRKWLSKNKSTQNFTVEKNFTQTFWKLSPSDLRGNHNKAFISIFRTKINPKIDYRPKNYNSSVNHTFRGHPTFMGHIPVVMYEQFKISSRKSNLLINTFPAKHFVSRSTSIWNTITLKLKLPDNVSAKLATTKNSLKNSLLTLQGSGDPVSWNSDNFNLDKIPCL